MRDGPPVLVVVGGLPATGKSTIAEHLARLVRAPYLRVDRIKQTIVAYPSLEHPIGAAGYAVAFALASEQLTLGLDVLVECVNPITLTRDSWPLPPPTPTPPLSRLRWSAPTRSSTAAGS